MANWALIKQQVLGKLPNAVLPGVKLPMLPTAVMQFSNKSQEQDCPIRELAKIVETDSGITSEILRFVNSSAFGLSRTCNNAQQAISLLGIRQSRMHLLTYGVKFALASKDSKVIGLKSFWAMSLERALFAREVARLLKVDLDLAFSGGLLQDLLIPILASEKPDVYTSYVSLSDECAPDLPQYEYQKFGWDHPLASGQLMSKWHFPDDLMCCVLLHHYGVQVLVDPDLSRTSLAPIALSALIPDQLKQVRGGLNTLLKIQAGWPEFDLHEIAKTIDAQYRELSPGVPLEFPLLHRVEKLMAKASV